MKKTSILAFAAAATLLCTGAAEARVAWSIGVDLPGVETVVSNAPVYREAPRLYVAPPVVYAPVPVYAPAPLYTPPPVVRYVPAPISYDAPPVYYRPAPVIVYRDGRPDRGWFHRHEQRWFYEHDRDHGPDGRGMRWDGPR